MRGEQFYKLSYLHLLRQMKDLEILVEEKESKIRTLSKRIHELEHTLIQTKIGALKEKKRQHIDNMNKFRAEIATDLGIQDIDNYLVDDETFELKHLDEIS